MKNFFLYTFLFCLIASVNIQAQNFEKNFSNKTLRIDYLFCGNASKQYICLDELSELPTWEGRRNHLTELPLEGNGQIIVRDSITHECLYKTSFSSLFQEWLETDEAKNINKAFQNTYLIPFPLRTAEVEVTLRNIKHENIAVLKHYVNPNDILIHKKGYDHVTPHRYLLKHENKNCIDIAILAEGYTEKEMDTFYADAEIAMNSIFSHEPFRSMKDRFNVVAVASPSEESGVSIPHKQIWKHTAFSSNFDTFYSERYLTSNQTKTINDALAGIPYEHIIILANTPQYGGGGIYNSYTLTTAHHPSFRPVVVHEFGHSFGGLADEYYYDNDVMTDTYPLNIEPWEQNVTTLVNFKGKWENLLKSQTPVPTPAAKKNLYPIGVYEGAAYSSKGIYRASDDCRMKTNDCPSFCPACQQALKKLILFYTE